MTSRTKRPRKTEFLLQFEKGIKELNDFLWSTLAAYKCALQFRPQNAETTSDFLPSDICKHLDVSASSFDSVIGDQQARLYKLILVEAVAIYEDYIGCVFEKAISEGWITPNKPVNLRISLEEIEKWKNAKKQLRHLSAAQISKQIVGEPYSERHSKIDKILNSESAKRSEHETSHGLLKIAGEYRNCIVHAGGIVDERTHNKCAADLPQLLIGQPLPLDRDFLLKLLHQLNNHARDIDLTLRLLRPPQEQ